MLSVTIGNEASPKIEIELIGYESTPTGEEFYDNWVAVTVDVHLGAFKGRFDASFVGHEFVEFRNQLEELNRTLKGTAKFTTIEGQLEFEMTINSLGVIEVKGYASDSIQSVNKLTFEYQIDQTYLNPIICELQNALENLPVKTPSGVS